jgi:hypothetical protein
VKEEELEGLAWNKVEARRSGGAGFGFTNAVKVMGVNFHLFEPVHDRRVEFVLVGEVPIEVGLILKHLWTKGAVMASGKLTEELMELEVTG